MTERVEAEASAGQLELDKELPELERASDHRIHLKARCAVREEERQETGSEEVASKTAFKMRAVSLASAIGGSSPEVAER